MTKDFITPYERVNKPLSINWIDVVFVIVILLLIGTAPTWL